ncbi:MAG TPA: hypothetical protein VMK12_24005 [Anaeromyxobacteraceae bacterium]|nr:hypothetical protein [Anaeromyxobacteraceae bacterium]
MVRGDTGAPPVFGYAVSILFDGATGSDAPERVGGRPTPPAVACRLVLLSRRPPLQELDHLAAAGLRLALELGEERSCAAPLSRTGHSSAGRRGRMAF